MLNNLYFKDHDILVRPHFLKFLLSAIYTMYTELYNVWFHLHQIQLCVSYMFNMLMYHCNEHVEGSKTMEGYLYHVYILKMEDWSD